MVDYVDKILKCVPKDDRKSLIGLFLFNYKGEHCILELFVKAVFGEKEGFYDNTLNYSFEYDIYNIKHDCMSFENRFAQIVPKLIKEGKLPSLEDYKYSIIFKEEDQLKFTDVITYSVSSPLLKIGYNNIINDILETGELSDESLVLYDEIILKLRDLNDTCIDKLIHSLGNLYLDTEDCSLEKAYNGCIYKLPIWAKMGINQYKFKNGEPYIDYLYEIEEEYDTSYNEKHFGIKDSTSRYLNCVFIVKNNNKYDLLLVIENNCCGGRWITHSYELYDIDNGCLTSVKNIFDTLPKLAPLEHSEDEDNEISRESIGTLSVLHYFNPSVYRKFNLLIGKLKENNVCLSDDVKGMYKEVMDGVKGSICSGNTGVFDKLCALI